MFNGMPLDNWGKRLKAPKGLEDLTNEIMTKWYQNRDFILFIDGDDYNPIPPNFKQVNVAIALHYIDD